jgi:hypothetical protein
MHSGSLVDGAAELGATIVPGQQHLACLKVDARLQHDDVDAPAAELDRLREVVSHDDAEGGDLCADAVDRIRLVHGRRSA